MTTSYDPWAQPPRRARHRSLTNRARYWLWENWLPLTATVLIVAVVVGIGWGAWVLFGLAAFQVAAIVLYAAAGICALAAIAVHQRF